jgi:branched-chain amino acid transport system substrate-binding protein
MITRRWMTTLGLGMWVGTVATVQAQETIKIGAPSSVAQGKEVRDGLTIAQEMINKQGGVLGKKIEILYEDHQGIPEKGRAAVEKLITRDKVVAITGEHASSVTLADIEVAHRHNIPLVNTNAWSDAVRLKGYPQVFNRSNYNTRVAEAMADVIARMKVKNVVAFAENTDYGTGQAEAMKKALAKATPDVKFTARVLDRAAKDFTPAVLPLKADRPDMIVTIMIPPASYLLMNQLYENGIAPSRQTWLYDGAGVADYPEFWDNVKDAGVGLVSFGLYHPKVPLTKLGKDVREAYLAKEKREPNRLIFRRFRVWSGSTRDVAWRHDTPGGGTARRHAGHRALPTAAGAEHAVDGDPGRAEGQGAAGRGVGGAPRGHPLGVPRVCRGPAAVRPRRGADVAAPGQLPVPDPPARPAAAGGLSDARRPAGAAALGGAAGAVYHAVRAAGDRRAAGD